MKERGRKKKSIRRQNRTTYLSVAVVVLILVGVLSFRCVELYQKNLEYAQKEEELQQQLAEEEDKQSEIESYRAYVGSDDYIIEMAREKLGLVFPGEEVFREN